MTAATRRGSLVVIDGEALAAVAWPSRSLDPAVSSVVSAVALPVAVSPRQCTTCISRFHWPAWCSRADRAATEKARGSLATGGLSHSASKPNRGDGAVTANPARPGHRYTGFSGMDVGAIHAASGIALQIGGHAPGTACAGQPAPGATANPQLAMATASSTRTSQLPPGRALRATI